MYGMYAFIAFVIVVVTGVYFMRLRQDKRQTPLNEIFEEGEAIHSVGPDTPVSECVRLMTAGKIGALISEHRFCRRSSNAHTRLPGYQVRLSVSPRLPRIFRSMESGACLVVVS